LIYIVEEDIKEAKKYKSEVEVEFTITKYVFTETID
jgi:hypothetical protein